MLQLNGGDDLAIDDDGKFTFATALNDLADYEVSILSQPASPPQICAVADTEGRSAVLM